MISTLRFPSVEQIAFETFLPIRIAFIVIFVLALARPSQFLYVLPLSYISYGMIANIVWAIRGRGSRSAA